MFAYHSLLPLSYLFSDVQLGLAGFKAISVGRSFLEDSHDIRAAELEVRNILSLLQELSFFNSDDD